MVEGRLIETRAEAEKSTEQILRVLRHTLIEVYMDGFMKGVESREENDALDGGEQPVADEPLVRLKRAILKLRLKQDEFSVRVWNTFRALDINTLGDILQVSESFYLKQRHFGRRSLNEIRDYVEKYGYHLK